MIALRSIFSRNASSRGEITEIEYEERRRRIEA